MIAILSDIHGNLPALQAVLDAALKRGCSRIISLGDMVGYYAQPGECIDLLRSYDAINIMGNHDRYLVQGSSCPRSRTVSRIAEYQRTVVTEDQLSWLSCSPPFHMDGRNLFVHGGPNDPEDQYLYAVSETTIPDGVENLFSGHTHVQVLARFGHKAYCNPGSVGQPRDGDRRAAYAVLDNDEITLQRVVYDIERTVDAMKRAGFEPRCYENLYSGAQIGGRIDHVKIIGGKTIGPD